MKREERVYLFVKGYTKEYTEQDIEIGKGVTTDFVARSLGIQRSNASKDLNQLVKNGLLGKLMGRPVKYVDICVLQHKPLLQHVESYKELTRLTNDLTLPEKDVFDHVIGRYSSMKTAVEQAKAAILYPPKGLNCLLTGATGTGKTHFAHTMFTYAQQQGLIDTNKELVTFNCADYAHNTELLMSYLFGFVEGSFTGADSTKDGLIHQANGSILFLDEIHRLPPEGQEMIFYFMDHGLYNRLGETTKSHTANVRIICATTENTNYSLLQTFLRRIPIHVQLPDFSERSPKEQVELVTLMFSLEANRIQRSIRVTEDVVKALIGSVTFGNIGQLKSNVQLICAQSFLGQIDSSQLSITIEELTPSLKEGLLQLSANRKATENLATWINRDLTFQPNQANIFLQQDPYELPYNLYDIIGDKAMLLKNDGISEEKITHYITTDINVHLKSFYKKQVFTFENQQRLSEIVDPKIIELAKVIYNLAKSELNFEYNTNFIYGMSLHISSSMKRGRSEYGRMNPQNGSLKKMTALYPKEYALSKKICCLIEKELNSTLPEMELDYLTLLLVSLRKDSAVGKIGIVVAAHGTSTASSMVKVVKHLLGSQNLYAVDMPMEMHPRKALEKIIEGVQTVEEGSGVLLLVDMGSLTTFRQEIEIQTKSSLRILDMVSTPVVLEAARKTSLIAENLEILYQNLKNFKGYSHQVVLENPVNEQAMLLTENIRPKAIVAICASGEGTARKMKEVIEQQLSDEDLLTLEVLPISVVDMDKKIKAICNHYQVLATTGILDPKIDLPHISMDQLFSNARQSLNELSALESSVDSTPSLLSEEQAQKLCIQYINESFTFLNSKKLIPVIWSLVKQFSPVKITADESFSFHVNLTMHMAGMIERVLRQEPLSLETKMLQDFQQDKLLEDIRLKILNLENTLQLTFPDQELYYVAQIIRHGIVQANA